MMDIDQEVMVGGQLVPMDKDGWPIISEDMGMHDDPDEGIMTKALQDAAKPSIARAGDQKAALQLRQAGVDISMGMQAALKAMRAAKKAEAACRQQARQAASTPSPKQRKLGVDQATPEDKGTHCKSKGKGEKNKDKVMLKKPASRPVSKHSHVTKWETLRLVHARGGANPKRRRC